MKVFNSVSDLALASLTADQLCEVKEVGRYRIKASGSGIGLANGNIAVPVASGTAVNVRQFGAVGDGVTDDTAAINLALNSGADVVSFDGSDTYIVTGQVLIKSNTTLQGNGATIKYSSMPTGAGVGYYGLYADQVDNIRIYNLEIDGNKSGYAATDAFGVYVKGCDNVVIADCKIHDCWRAGIHGGHVTVGQSTNCIYKNNYIYNIGDSGDATQYGNGIAIVHDKYVVIEGNIIENVYGTASINLEGDTYSDITIIGNQIKAGTGSNLRGISMYEAGAEIHDNIVIANNIIVGQLSAGISLVGSGDITVTGNIVRDCGDEGIRSISSANSNLTITDNQIFNCASGAVANVNIASCTTLICTGNKVAECAAGSTIGYYLKASESAVIEGNIANDVQTDAFNLAVTNFSFTNNVSNDVGLVGSGSNYFLKNITGNVCSDGVVANNVLNNGTGTATAFWLINGGNWVDVECGNNRSNVTKYSYSSASNCKINKIDGPNAPDLGGVFGNTATWEVGDIVYDQTPSASGQIGWVCVTAGTPGTWKAFGAISA